MNTHNKNKIIVIAIFIFIFICLILRNLHSLSAPFYDWDESIYVQSGKEMVNSGNFFVPLWQGTIWLDKPPLIILIYGLIVKLSVFIPPEITTRIFTLMVAAFVLTLIYVLYNKILKNNLLAILTSAITAFTPIFLQRAQTVNLDIFLLLGWLGYFVFFDNFIISFLFLFIGVMAKSLLGFYPIFIFFFYYIWQLFIKKIAWNKFKKIFFKLAVQASIPLFWYGIMLAIFGKAFWIQHIIESHFRRVTSSIEFHFGDRIFFVTLAHDQMNYFFWLAIAGGLIITYRLIKDKLPGKKILISFYLLPWFMFLNLVKTKIFWYFYPAIPQFAFLSVGWISEIKNKTLVTFICLLLTLLMFYQFFIKQNVLTVVYSKPEAYYYLSLYAKDKCQSLNVLMDKNTRESFATLDRLGLLITTTKWWGSHPSMVYYFGKKVNFFYEESNFTNQVNSAHHGQCFVIDKQDSILVENKHLNHLKDFSDFYLYLKD